MSRVNIELFFPLSRGVDKKQKGQIKLCEETVPDESVRRLLSRLSTLYPNLESILFDEASKEVSNFVCILLNDRDLQIPDGLAAKLNDGDTLSLLPMYLGG